MMAEMALVVVIAVSALGEKVDKFTALFGPDGQTILETSREITLYSLNPHPKVEDRRPRLSGREGQARAEFHGYPILHRVVLRGEAKEKLLGKFYTAMVEDSSPARCFVPRHGIRAEKDDRFIDLVICFECQQVESYMKGKKGGAIISASPVQSFDEALRR